MHLAIHTQYYPPEIGAPQARLSALAERAAQHGHHVTVLTAMPNYPGGKIYPGYGGILCREKINEINVIRSFIYPTQKTDVLKRLMSYFSFLCSSAAIGSLHLHNIDYLLTESPPLFLGMSGYILSQIKSARWIFNVSDLWPKSAVYLDILSEKSIPYYLSTSLENIFYRQAWLVSGQSKSILEDISRRFPRCKVFHLSNGVDTRKFGAKFGNEKTRKCLGREDEFIIIYAGLHGIAQGLDQIIKVASQIREKGNFRFVLIGDGPEKEKLMKIVQSENTTNVSFLNPRPRNEIPALLASADVIMVPLKKHIPGAVPSKLYEAMASQKPIILVAEGEAADIVNRTESGIVITPGDINGIKEAIMMLYDDPSRCKIFGRNGRKAAQKYFDRTRIVDRFIDYLEVHA